MWFDIDKKGLAALMNGRPKSFILNELLSNAWDQKVTEVSVTVSPVAGKPVVEISVLDDDPDGFADLTHAYTLFAESSKKANPEQRGRFNLGEKLVLALARSATIQTTKGTVIFTPSGRETISDRRASGSCITVWIPMTRAEMDELLDDAQRLIPPVPTTVNGVRIPDRELVTEFEYALPTLIADSEGVLRPTRRKVPVRVHEPVMETGWLYELGVPVVETGDRYDVDIGQKVPLNSDRDNVTPAYLREVRVAVLNAVADRLQWSEATQTWVKEACSDPRVRVEAAARAFELRFGNAVAYDPSDPEANKLAVVAGYNVVHGRSLSADEWANARRAGVLKPAGQVTPSPKPFSPDGTPLDYIDPTYEMLRIQRFSETVAERVLGEKITVSFVNDCTWPFNATYGSGILIYNVGRLGRPFFDEISDAVIDLLIHELAHEYEKDHLSRAYNDALTKVGAKVVRLALEEPELFQ